MSALTVLCVILLVSATSFPATSAGRLDKVETALNNIDLKMHAYSNDILALKKDVADTNNKLDLILELINNTNNVPGTSHGIGASTGNTRPASDRVVTLHAFESTVKTEISRVRRAFLSEKNKLSRQQNHNAKQFLEFSTKLNDTLATLYNRQDTTWALAADSINTSVASVLGSVRTDIDNHLILWNQSIHDNMEEKTNTTLATMNVFNHELESWNGSIYHILHEVDNTFQSFINTSFSQHDNFTKTLQTELISSRREIKDSLKEQTNKTGAMLENIHESINAIDRNVNGFINTSLIQHDNFTKTLQTELISSQTEIKDSIRSMDYSDTLSNIVSSMQSHDTKVDKIIYDIQSRSAVRLVGSHSSSNRGRLEVYINGRWGTVCDDGFDNTDATVVCKMLAYSSGTYKDKAYFGQGTLPIVMDDVECTGRETSIRECPFNRDTTDCSHSEDVGVICT